MGVSAQFEGAESKYTITNNNFINLDFAQANPAISAATQSFIAALKANNTFSDAIYGWVSADNIVVY